jgi:membrane-bound lytic murein transglycosylase D
MRALAICVLVCSATVCRGQQDTLSVDDMVSSAQQWARENLDDNTLQALQQVDREKVREILAGFQKKFQGEYVLDLAQLKQAAPSAILLLDSYEETMPYALWLKNRLDYLDVAEQLSLSIPLPKPKPGQPPRPAPIPTPQQERNVWITRLTHRAYPDQAKPYVSQLKSVFAAERVPPELIWIAEVESSFDPRVRSPAGAAGLFQLMPATAKRYGLRTTWPFDQRLTPEPSARAAAEYLRYLHGHFKDWRLALAAYNAGEGTVDNLLVRSKAHSYDDIAGRLPAETQLYVPKVEAILLRREGVKLAQLAIPKNTAGNGGFDR